MILSFTFEPNFGPKLELYIRCYMPQNVYRQIRKTNHQKMHGIKGNY